MDTGIQELFKQYHKIDISNLVDYTPYLLMKKPIKSEKLTLLFANTLTSASEITNYEISDEKMMRIKYPLIREGKLNNAFTSVVYSKSGNLILCSYGIVVVNDHRHIQILEGAINKDIYKNPNAFEFQIDPQQRLVDLLNLN